MDTSDPTRPGAEAVPAEPPAGTPVQPPAEAPAEPPAEAPAEAPAEVSAEAPAKTPAPGRRPRGLTTLIVACAALVGVVGGTATGYAIQAERKPTPLPALSQADLAYPAKALPESKRPAPLPAEHDTAVKANGDLRKLLVGKPKGFREASGYFVNGVSPQDGWLSPGGRSLEYTEPGEVLVDSVRNGIRRVAAANWQRGEYEYVAVRLVQFRPGAVAEAQADAASSRWDAANRTRSGHEEGREVKAGSGAGFFVYEPDSKPGYLTVYGGRAVGYRGDVMFDLHFSDTKPLSEKAIKDLALKQLERL
ncbi:hypothetical protein DI273_17650 [Streptomyces violascens]|nr:hypothetical protein DI273_17650 [Streptomyces violascens]